MYDILFYIFSLLILTAVFIISFKGSSYSLFFYIPLLLAGSSGYFLLLNYGFISVILALIIISAMAVIALGRKYLIKIPSESQNESKTSLISVITISMLTALIAGLGGTAKWQNFEIDYLVNNFSQIFNTYIPAIIAAALLFSVLISTAFKLFIPGKAEH